MTNDIVSIIIPIYNVAPFVDECVRSVCAQTYSHTEIILVDDGSTDESAAICDAWQEKDTRIKVIHKENGGLSDARNAGLDAATGKYILFIDGDDTIEPNLLEAALPYMDKDVEMVSFGYRLVYPDGSRTDIPFRFQKFSLNSEIARRDFFFGPFFRYEAPWSACRLYTRELIETFHLRFVDTKRIRAEDMLFSLFCYCHAKEAIHLDVCLYNYRQRANSIMDHNRKDEKTDIYRKNNLSKELLSHMKQWPDCAHFIEFFPALHFLIIERNLQGTRNNFFPSLRRFRNAVMQEAEASDIDYFTQQLRDFSKVKDELKRSYNAVQIAEKAGCCRFLLRGYDLPYAVLSTAKILRDKIAQKRSHH